MQIYVVGLQQRIDALQSKAGSDIMSNDPELQAQLARFLCVLSSGLIERAVTGTLSDYANRRSHSRVANYVSNALSKLHNAKFRDIVTTVGRFDPAWQKHFEETTGEDVKAAIDSIVNNRNQIAHGIQTGISLASFISYHSLVKKFLADFDVFIAEQ